MHPNNIPIDPSAAIFGVIFLGVLPFVLSIFLLKFGIKMFNDYKFTFKKINWFGSSFDWLHTRFVIGSIAIIILSIIAIPSFAFITISIIKQDLWASVIAPLIISK